jgi:signal transduction histidine kinase
LIQDKVVLEVIDNATGISNEQMSLIFQPFYSTKDIEHNMGLGLSIVDSIVTSFGGRINVFNNDIGGTTFRVELPVWDHQVHYETEYSTAVSFAVDNISD